jgi:hypothetical protein
MGFCSAKDEARVLRWLGSMYSLPIEFVVVEITDIFIAVREGEGPLTFM